MKDFINQDIKVGDVVAYVSPRYSKLWLGTVSGFTPKGVQLFPHGREQQINRAFHQIVKVGEEL